MIARYNKFNSNDNNYNNSNDDYSKNNENNNYNFYCNKNYDIQFNSIIIVIIGIL